MTRPPASSAPQPGPRRGLRALLARLAGSSSEPTPAPAAGTTPPRRRADGPRRDRGHQQPGQASLPRAWQRGRTPRPGEDQPTPPTPGIREISRYLRVPRRELTEPFSLDRVEAMLVGAMDYRVERTTDPDGHPSLQGAWDGFPFLIEEPEDHPGTLLVAGEWTEPAALSQREEIAASVNDWNREKFFPTVCVIDGALGPLVRATYLIDLSAGVTDSQLRLHLDTALASCTQALAQVGPLLPELGQ